MYHIEEATQHDLFDIVEVGDIIVTSRMSIERSDLLEGKPAVIKTYISSPYPPLSIFNNEVTHDI